jgi:hypothetical protein
MSHKIPIQFICIHGVTFAILLNQIGNTESKKLNSMNSINAKQQTAVSPH